jgi:S1-C subfamily serine protease
LFNAESDIALLKIDAEGLRPIALTDINEVSVGDVALAVGNPLGVGQTVTQGIIGTRPLDSARRVASVTDGEQPTGGSHTTSTNR